MAASAVTDVVQNGDLVYLSLDGDPQQSIATVYTGVKYWFPTVSSSKVKLRLTIVDPPHATQLTEGAYVTLSATEPRVGEHMRLSAYRNENCYYWDALETNQQWQVHSVDTNDGLVHYDKGLTLTNIQYSPERLVPKDGYLTTKVLGDDDSTWVITKAP